MADHSFQKMMMMRGSQRSCFFILPNIMAFLVLFLILVLLQGAPAASSATTKMASSCSNGTKGTECVSMANHRIEDEEEGAPGGEFLESLQTVAHFTDRTLKPPPVCNNKIYQNCIAQINSQHRPCEYYDRCRSG